MDAETRVVIRVLREKKIIMLHTVVSAAAAAVTQSEVHSLLTTDYGS